jgi:NAD(P)-dependent dehydrogenase (short-subunit alcohol dehydrogenase family)
MTTLRAKVVLVAGADNIVGAAVVARFGGEGARVVGLRDDDGGGTSGAADTAARAVRPLEPASWQAAFEDCHREHGRVDLFVNARQRVRRGDIRDTGGAAFAAAFREVASANWLAQKHAILALRRCGGGVLINVIPVLARVAAPSCAALCAAARGLLMSTKSAALECARNRDGIVVSAVLAGRIEGDPEHWPDGTLLPRAPAVTAEEVASGALFLATGGAAYMTGVELPVDGGFLAS